MPPRPHFHFVDLRPPEQRAAAPLASPEQVTALTLEQIEDGQHGLTPALGPLLVVCQRGTQADLAARYLRADGLEAQAWRGDLSRIDLEG